MDVYTRSQVMLLEAGYQTNTSATGGQMWYKPLEGIAMLSIWNDYYRHLWNPEETCWTVARGDSNNGLISIYALDLHEAIDIGTRIPVPIADMQTEHPTERTMLQWYEAMKGRT